MHILLGSLLNLHVHFYVIDDPRPIHIHLQLENMTWISLFKSEQIVSESRVMRIP